MKYLILLTDNQITEIGGRLLLETIPFCTLKYLNLDDSATPLEFQGKKTDEIRQYFLDFTAGSEEIVRVKLQLVGDGMQGKTSLLHFLEKRKRMEKEPERTDGIDIKIWKETKENDEVTISCWDFAGQEVNIYFPSISLSQFLTS